MQLKICNRKSQNDYIDLADLKPDFSLKLTQEVKTMMTHFKKVVQEFVQLHNDYVRMKINEEKAKAKRPKVNEEALDKMLNSKYEQITFEAEMTRVVKDMVKNLPETIQGILERNHLNMLLGLKVDSSIKPKLGSMWNTVSLFPTVLPHQV